MPHMIRELRIIANNEIQLPNNSPRYGKRTTATGMQLTIGNSAGILSSFI